MKSGYKLVPLMFGMASSTTHAVQRYWQTSPELGDRGLESLEVRKHLITVNYLSSGRSWISASCCV